MLISYDTPRSIDQKVYYIVSKGLGGVMWWETSGNKPGNSSLIAMVRFTLALALEELM
jgi:chitinase